MSRVMMNLYEIKVDNEEDKRDARTIFYVAKDIEIANRWAAREIEVGENISSLTCVRKVLVINEQAS